MSVFGELWRAEGKGVEPSSPEDRRTTVPEWPGQPRSGYLPKYSSSDSCRRSAASCSWRERGRAEGLSAQRAARDGWAEGPRRFRAGARERRSRGSPARGSRAAWGVSRGVSRVGCCSNMVAISGQGAPSWGTVGGVVVRGACALLCRDEPISSTLNDTGEKERFAEVRRGINRSAMRCDLG